MVWEVRDGVCLWGEGGIVRGRIKRMIGGRMNGLLGVRVNVLELCIGWLLVFFVWWVVVWDRVRFGLWVWVVGVGNLRGGVVSRRGGGWREGWCRSCVGKGMGG